MFGETQHDRWHREDAGDAILLNQTKHLLHVEARQRDYRDAFGEQAVHQHLHAVDMKERKNPDDDVVLDTHFRPSGKPEQIQFEFGLHLSEEPPEKHSTIVYMNGETINVAPGERYTVLVNPDEVGTWVWHCHILTHVEREEGMFGMVTAVVVT